MTDAEQMKQNAVGVVKSQIDRMRKSLHRSKKRETYTNIQFANSLVGQEIETLRQTIREQCLTIDSFKLSGFIKELDSALERKRQNERINRMIRKRNALVDELNEINKSTASASQDQKEFSRILGNLNAERPVLEDLIKSTYEDNNRNIIKYLNF